MFHGVIQKITLAQFFLRHGVDRAADCITAALHRQSAMAPASAVFGLHQSRGQRITASPPHRHAAAAAAAAAAENSGKERMVLISWSSLSLK